MMPLINIRVIISVVLTVVVRNNTNNLFKWFSIKNKKPQINKTKKKKMITLHTKLVRLIYYLLTH